MGTYYSATTIIGFKILSEKRFDIQILPNCEHQHGLASGFCPECGKKIGTHERRRYLDQDIWDEFYHFYNHLPCNMAYEWQESRDVLWIGYGQASDRDSFGFRPLRPYDQIKAEVITMLKPFTDKGIFTLDYREFGIWTLNIGH